MNPDPEEVRRSQEISLKAHEELQQQRLKQQKAYFDMLAERQRQEAESRARDIENNAKFLAARNTAPICQNCTFFIDGRCHAQLPEVVSGVDAAGFRTGVYPRWSETDRSCRCSLFEKKAEPRERACRTCRHWHERFSEISIWPIPPENPGIRTCTAIPRHGGKFPLVKADNFCGAWEPVEDKDAQK